MRCSQILLLACLALAACDTAATDPPPGDEAPVPRGSRVLTIQIVEAEVESYDEALSVAEDLGAEAVTLSLTWQRLEPEPGTFDLSLLDVAESYFPAAGLKLDLMIGPVDTNNDVRPSDLQDLPFDHPEVIGRFEALLDAALPRIPSVELTFLALGNEVDALLADADAWAAYTVLYEAAAERARALRPGTDLGVKVTSDGLTGGTRALAQRLNAGSDVVLTTYYPLADDFTVRPPTVVRADFDAIAAAYPDRPVYLAEAGYPASPQCESSDAMQAAFVRELFRAWDDHADQFRGISYSFLTDFSPASVGEFEVYYGISDERFLGFLGSLGLRSYDRSERPAFAVFRDEAAARGW
ncbi:MAG: hypothetical protein AAGI91_12490 [Bacteroidota bacterium]